MSLSVDNIKKVQIATLAKYTKMSRKRIASVLKVGHEKVQKYAEIDVFDVSSYEIKRGRGRKSKITRQIINRAKKEMTKKYGMGTRSFQKRLSGEGKYFSRSSILRAIKKQPWGRAYRITRSPMLSKKNILDRERFFNRLVSEGYLDKGNYASRLKIRTVLWTDESPIELQPRPNSQNMQIRSDSKEKVPDVKVPKFSLKIMVAGGICGYGKTRLIVLKSNETVNTAKYSQMLDEYAEDVRAIESANRVKLTFMQDGAPAHTANSNQNKCKTLFHSFWKKNEWPGNSPDLNPVENVWAWLQESVFEEPRPTDRQKLIERVQDCWNKISIDELRKLTDSLQSRLDQLKEKNFQKINY